MEKSILLSPPLVFLFFLVLSLILTYFLTKIAFKPKEHTEGERKSYACGEDNYSPMVQIDYSQFFPFAFFFTIAHVATLIMCTVPTETVTTFIMAFVYLIGIFVSLLILLRSQE